ncbi:hypothetical protein L0657_05415 [Dyadobacter sp. CY345]|uniref:hypothetical protein n=1 Tax=Dyadobacter sp. CY345 TaxID=2909335 RepID=UPI001F28174D|nr:hypothetical protein [Dyadobacter sp. CY345]MCF2443387.1 hypothetical protein [Dyadobacter sp. CY345]
MNTRFKRKSVFSIPFILSAIAISEGSPLWVMLMDIPAFLRRRTYSNLQYWLPRSDRVAGAMMD